MSKSTKTTPIHVDLIAEIDAYCARNSVTRSAFGSKAMGDPSLYIDLVAGRELRRATERKLRDLLARD